MKSIRKFALVLLSMVMLFTLTSCSGSGGSNGTPEDVHPLTSKINEKLSGTGIQVTYDSALNEKLAIYMNVYLRSGSKSSALKAAELDAEHYEVYTANSNELDYVSSVFAEEIKVEKATSGRIAKSIGYASGRSTTGSITNYALVQYP